MRVSDMLRSVRQSLSEGGIESPAYESRLLVSFVLGIPVKELPMYFDKNMSEVQLSKLQEIIRKRKSGFPVQYILGEWEFMGLPFMVTPSVLIPRQDTELLCEMAIKEIRERSAPVSVLDLCTGSGCLGVSIAHLTGATVTLSDISAESLAVARQNALLNHVEVEILQGDLFAPFDGRKFDVIVSNPPYLKQTEMDDLQPEVRFEPEHALYGGEDGLVFYRRIAETYRGFLKENGVLLMEFGYTQAADLLSLFPNGRVFQDLAGNDRVIEVR